MGSHRVLSHFVPTPFRQLCDMNLVTRLWNGQAIFACLAVPDILISLWCVSHRRIQRKFLLLGR